MKPPHVESWEFLQDIAAENGMQYLDVIRVIGKSKEFSTYWVESEPGIGLSLKESTTFNSNNA